MPEIHLFSPSLSFLQAIGDGGQGWGNAILYIFMSPVMRERLIGEWCGKCMDKMDDRLNRFGDQTNTVQYRARGSDDHGPRKEEPTLNRSELSSETVPILRGNKARGYNIKKYDTTTSATEGLGTGTDLSFT